MRMNIAVPNETSLLTIQGASNVSTTATTASFGTKPIDGSWTWVTTCSTLMASPTTRMVASSGALTTNASLSKSETRPIATAVFMPERTTPDWELADDLADVADGHPDRSSCLHRN